MPHFLKVKPGSFSSQESSIMAGLQLMTCLPRWTMQSTSLRASQGDLHRASSSLTMPQAIRSVPMMQSQLVGCLKVCAPMSLLDMQFIHSLVPKRGWSHHPSGPRMCNGTLPSGEPQPFYFPDDHPTMPSWFKGMEQIICEHGLWPEGGLAAQCPDFKCPPNRTDCCCWCLLFTQPDFLS